MKLTDLKDKKLTELKEIAKQMNIEKSSSMSKDDLLTISSNEKNDKPETQKPNTDEHKQKAKKSTGVLEIYLMDMGF